jgi:hypothetical protein
MKLHPLFHLSKDYVKNFLFVLSLLVLLNCSDKVSKKDVLSETKMAAILIDIHIAEAKVHQVTVGSRDSTAAVYLALEAKILKKNKVSKKLYKKSFNYYNDRPDLMEKIYTAVIDSLNVRQKMLKID